MKRFLPLIIFGVAVVVDRRELGRAAKRRRTISI